MLLFYLDKIKSKSSKYIYSVLRDPSLPPFFFNLFCVVLSLCISVYLKLGDEVGGLLTGVILLNAMLAILIGASVGGAQAFYPSNKVNSGLIFATAFNLLYLPLLLLLPDELSFPSSTLFINWFVMVILLQIPLKIQFKSPPMEREQKRSSPQSVQGLIQRPSLDLDRKLIQNAFKGKRVLLVGAGGSLGSEFIQQISLASPSHIGLVDNNEHQLLQAHLEVKDALPNLSSEAFLGDICSRERIRYITSSFKPDIVIHDATLRQIPIGESNLSQTILTNVIGTQNLADACRDFKVKVMLYISCHEAGLPTNIIGVSKRLGEGYCLALDKLERKKLYGTRFVVTRIGNLLDSLGSVVPVFKRQIKKGGPVTVTHPDAARHFMRIEDAVELVLHAMVLGTVTDKQGSSIFALERGEPIKIAHLAEQMIQMEGSSAKVKFVGLRQGEKRSETFIEADGQATSNPHISAIPFKVMDHGFLVRALRELEQVAKNQDKDSAMRILQALVPEYKNQELHSDPAFQAVS